MTSLICGTFVTFVWTEWEKHNKIRQDTMCPGWDVNIRPPKYEAGATKPNVTFSCDLVIMATQKMDE
jgi:hypothetical protein